MDGETTREICVALAEIGAKRVDLLPFHRLGSGKYRALGLEYAYADTKPPEKEEMDKLLAEYSRHFDARLDG
jgi:pyruvate formate lyase activating enzyme